MAAELGPNLDIEGRYRLTTPLGKGGNGEVWEALSSGGQRVAIKFLLAAHAPDSLRRFELEARVLSRFDHPGCVRVVESGRTSDGLAFIVMELVQGETLYDWAQRDRGIDEIVEVGAQIAGVLAAAHRQGFIHRDLKPSNVMVLEGPGPPRVKVLDFGLTKVLGIEQTDITKTGELHGTPGYMSPEQLRGVKTIGPATDLYCLGLVLYVLLEGRPPFPGRTALEIGLRHLSDPVPPLARSMEPWLRELVGLLLQKNPGDRPPAAVVERLLTTRGAASLRKEETPAALRRSPMRAIGIVVAIGIGLAAILALAVFVSPPAANSTRLDTPQRAVPAFVKQPAENLTRRGAPVPVVDEGSGSASDMNGDVDASGPCSRPTPFVGTGTLRLDRSVTAVHIPRNYDPKEPAPVVFLFHRQSRTGEQALFDTKIAPVADELGFVVIAPDSRALRSDWPESDRSRLPTVFADASEVLCLDPERIFAIGDAESSTFVFELACRLPLSGYAVTFDVVSRSCQPAAPTPRIRLYGERDDAVPPEGGRSCNPIILQVSPAATHDVNWRAEYGCKGRERKWGDFVGGACRTWDCELAPIVTCATDAGHHWPGGEGYAFRGLCEEAGEFEFPLAEAILNFFDEHGHRLTPDERAEYAGF